MKEKLLFTSTVFHWLKCSATQKTNIFLKGDIFQSLFCILIFKNRTRRNFDLISDADGRHLRWVHQIKSKCKSNDSSFQFIWCIFVLSKKVRNLTIMGFEPRISGEGSDRCTNLVQIPAPFCTFCECKEIIQNKIRQVILRKVISGC